MKRCIELQKTILHRLRHLTEEIFVFNQMLLRKMGKKVVEKSAMEKLDSNYYSATIGYETTKDLALGLYTIELLVVESETSRSILVKQGSFPVYDSASKDIE